jgi:hypothetical protein
MLNRLAHFKKKWHTYSKGCYESSIALCTATTAEYLKLVAFSLIIEAKVDEGFGKEADFG